MEEVKQFGLQKDGKTIFRYDRSKNLGNYSLKGKSPLNGIKQSPELIKKRAIALMGHVISEETRKKISMSHLGLTPWNKDSKTGIITSGFTGHKHSTENIKKFSQMRKGRAFTDDHKNKLGSKKDNHWNWKGGITPLNQQIRKSDAIKMWRNFIFSRDNFKCVQCGKGGDIQADHIKPFALFPELRFDINNGQTLCKRCHLVKTIGDWKIFNKFRNGGIYA